MTNDSEKKAWEKPILSEVHVSLTQTDDCSNGKSLPGVDARCSLNAS